MSILSVIIPVFNMENYLRKCLDSVVNQTLMDIEIIIVNDGSTDNSIEIIREYEKKHNNIIVIDKENEGVGAARNEGIKVATARYITFLDSDDYIDLDMYQKMINVAIKTSVSIVECGIKLITEDGEIIGEFSNKKNLIRYTNPQIIQKFLCFEIKGYVWHRVYEKKLFEEGNIEFPLKNYYEDMIVSFKLLEKCKEIIIINDVYYYYCQRNNSSSHQITERNIKEYSVQMKTWLKECSLLDKESYKEYIISFHIYAFLNLLNWYIKYCQYDRKRIHQDFNNYFQDIVPNVSLLECILNKQISKGIKLIYLLWKLKIYDLILKYKIMK